MVDSTRNFTAVDMSKNLMQNSTVLCIEFDIQIFDDKYQMSTGYE